MPGLPRSALPPPRAAGGGGSPWETNPMTDPLSQSSPAFSGHLPRTQASSSRRAGTSFAELLGRSIGPEAHPRLDGRPSRKQEPAAEGPRVPVRGTEPPRQGPRRAEPVPLPGRSRGVLPPERRGGVPPARASLGGRVAPQQTRGREGTRGPNDVPGPGRPDPVRPDPQPGGVPEGAAPADEPLTEPIPPDEPPTRAPHIPRYVDVPEAWKHPSGPYQQAPEEYGGLWWFVSPFTGPEPWKTQGGPGDAPAPAAETLPPGFEEVFGTRPTAGDFPGSYADFVTAKIRWEQDLQHFQEAGIPEGFTEADVELAGDVLEAWGLGRPVFYRGRFGWMARYPDAAIPNYETNASAALDAPHLVVSRFQSALLQDGVTPEHVHPFVPPVLIPEGVQAATLADFDGGAGEQTPSGQGEPNPEVA